MSSSAKQTIVKWRGGVPIAIKMAGSRRWEAAEAQKLRKAKRARASINQDTRRGAKNLREQARWLEQNYDLASGALDVLVRNIVGTGILPDPMVRNRGGELIPAINDALLDIHKIWFRAPEVTGELDGASMQRLKCRTLFRDGESFAQYLVGNVPNLVHNTEIPLSLELIDPDFVPLHMTQPHERSGNVVQGIRKNAWGQAVSFFVAKDDPAEGLRFAGQYKEVAAERMQHLKLMLRLRQTRGVSVFASAMQRLDDVRDYDESERVAAKVAASMAAFIKKGAPDRYGEEQDEDVDPEPRDMMFRPGMVFDDLMPGEDIGTIDTNRPNTALPDFVSYQLRAASRGLGIAHSSFANDFEGTYSSRRQESSEHEPQYGILWSYFVERGERPTWQRLVDVAIASGRIEITPDVNLSTLYDCEFSRPVAPMIDPQKEAGANEDGLNSFQTTLVDVWRRRGKKPADMWAKLQEQAQLLETIQGAAPSQNPSATPDTTDDEEKQPSETQEEAA